MKFGFGVPNRGSIATRENLATLAQHGEEMGFDIIYGVDRLVVPEKTVSRYPYPEPHRQSDERGGPVDDEGLELLTTLAFLAANTSIARLLTSVMILPYRSPVLTAKMLATIDVLSQGRLIVGCGLGWMREEFESLGTHPFNERGAVTDEYIQAFKELWTSDNPNFEGKYCHFSKITFLPKPIQKPHPPIWIGGESPQALRRAAVFGDVWYPVGNNPRFPVGTPCQISKNLVRLQHYAENAGRDPLEISLAYNAMWYTDREAQRLASGERRIFTGSPVEVADDMKVCEQLGMRYLILDFRSDTLEGMLERMDRFTTKVRPLAMR